MATQPRRLGLRVLFVLCRALETRCRRRATDTSSALTERASASSASRRTRSMSLHFAGPWATALAGLSRWSDRRPAPLISSWRWVAGAALERLGLVVVGVVDLVAVDDDRAVAAALEVGGAELAGHPGPTGLVLAAAVGQELGRAVGPSRRDSSGVPRFELDASPPPPVRSPSPVAGPSPGPLRRYRLARYRRVGSAP
jgi:hypothetical protein